MAGTKTGDPVGGIWRKNPPFNPDPEKPFAMEPLGRNRVVAMLTQLVQSTNQPFVLSVEAPFGHGKTTFLNLWKAHLEKTENHLCLSFNAWENDFVDDPMIAFLGELDRALTKAKKDPDGFPIPEVWKDVKRYAGKIVRAGLPLAIQIGTVNVLKSEQVKEFAGALSNHGEELSKSAGDFMRKKLDDYESSRQTIAGFRKALTTFAKKVAEEKRRRSPIVFFIDELDRCRPDFAVALLERIKHLFQVEGIFFVLGLDRNQLSHSVRVLYGQGMDAEGYLRRFMDVCYQLPPPQEAAFANHLFERFKFEEILGPPERDEARLFLNRFSTLALRMGLSLRAQEQCFTDLNVALRTTGTIIREADVVATVFLVLFRAWKPDEYRSMITGKISPEDFSKLLPNKNGSHWDWVPEAIAILANPNRHHAQYRSQLLNQEHNLLKMGDERRERISKLLEMINRLQGAFPITGFTPIERVEMLPDHREKHYM